MSTEYIREVNIREGKVYLTSKSSNDDIPYHTWFCESLSRIYSEEGQQGLDREILRMLCEYATLNGTHPSITRYRHALKAPQKRIICQRIRRTRSQLSPRRQRLSEKRKGNCLIRSIRRWPSYVSGVRIPFLQEQAVFDCREFD